MIKQRRVTKSWQIIRKLRFTPNCHAIINPGKRNEIFNVMKNCQTDPNLI